MSGASREMFDAERTSNAGALAKGYGGTESWTTYLRLRSYRNDGGRTIICEGSTTKGFKTLGKILCASPAGVLSNAVHGGKCRGSIAQDMDARTYHELRGKQQGTEQGRSGGLHLLYRYQAPTHQPKTAGLRVLREQRQGGGNLINTGTENAHRRLPSWTVVFARWLLFSNRSHSVV